MSEILTPEEILRSFPVLIPMIGLAYGFLVIGIVVAGVHIALLIVYHAMAPRPFVQHARAAAAAICNFGRT